VANQNHNGGRDAVPGDHRGNWRPQDQAPQATSHRVRGRDDDDRSWRDGSYRDADRRAGERDPRRWEGGRGSELGHHEDRDPEWRTTERYGQGQSGYSAGRHGDDRAQRLQNRNDMTPGGSFEDRNHDLGVDDRFTGRGRSGYWQDRPGRDADVQGARAYEAARGHGREGNGDRVRAGGHFEERTGYHGAQQGDQQVGYQSGSYGQVYGHIGYSPRQQGLQDEVHRSSGAGHTHRGTGPHRGRGPLGYQRSDERIREGVCESLTEDDEIDATQIEVSVRNGEVTLAGVVEDRRAKRNAEDCAYTVSGVRDVQNLLRVHDDDRTSRGSFGRGGVGNDVESPHDSRKPRA
jgi:hypothetical protein